MAAEDFSATALTSPQRVPASPGRLVSGLRRAVTPLALAALVFVGCVVPMTRSANYTELSTAPDEAAHYVTALMIRTYVVEALGSNPLDFAVQYYVKYPKVAFGIWPPLFHILLGAWLLLTGPSFLSALSFVAVTTALMAVVLFVAGKDVLGIPLAFAGAVWFATFPIVQASATSVMMDALCALFVLLATLALGRYMDAPGRGSALAFGCAAAAALLTKYNAFALALVPPLAVLAGRRWSLLRRLDFWLMPLTVVILIAPWYATHLDMMRYASEPVPPPGAWWPASRENFMILALQVHVLMPLAALGIHECLVVNKGRNGVWCAFLAMLVAVWGFHSLLYPTVQPRYLLAAAGALALFGAFGVEVLVTHMLPAASLEIWHRLRAGAAVLVVIVLATFTPIPRSPVRGFGEAAALVLHAHPPADTTTLVSADPIGEGAYVSYVAANASNNDNLVVIRASKILAAGTWMGLNYASLYDEPESVSNVLDRARVQSVVVDDSTTEPHHELLERTVRTSPQWHLARRIAVDRSAPVRVYERLQPLPPGKPQFELGTSYSLGHNLKRSSSAAVRQERTP
jgi:hypothetical protein